MIVSRPQAATEVKLSAVNTCFLSPRPSEILPQFFGKPMKMSDFQNVSSFISRNTFWQSASVVWGESVCAWVNECPCHPLLFWLRCRCEIDSELLAWWQRFGGRFVPHHNVAGSPVKSNPSSSRLAVACPAFMCGLQKCTVDSSSLLSPSVS